MAKARALALVEVERRPAGDGRAAWSFHPPLAICGRVRVATSTVPIGPVVEIAGRPYPLTSTIFYNAG